MINRIDVLNTNRFRDLETNAILAIYDVHGGTTFYADVCADDSGNAIFDLSTVRALFSDEVEEI